MFEYAVVHVGIDPKYFYKLTLYEYRLLYARHLFDNAKAWEHSRLISYTLYSVNSTKKVGITDFMPLLTDNRDKVKPMTIAEAQSAQEKALALYAQVNK